MRKLLKLFRSADSSLPDTIRFFRSLGFFEVYAGQSNQEVADALSKQYAEYWGVEFDPSNAYSDLMLLAFDKDRVWWQDTEADVCSGRTVYKRTLQEWSTISHGSFHPQNISEVWESEDGPIKINFEHDGKKVSLHPKFLDDYIDLSILSQINRFISPTGIQFELYRPFDQTGFVVALTADEKKLLESKRDWQFVKRKS